MPGNQLIDNWGRPITYLRLAVTDRCNLRCFYCMPEHGINYLAKEELLTYEEMYFLVRTLCEMGITKVRITGGEPFIRKNLISFLKSLKKIPTLKSLHLTTNGLLLDKHFDEVIKLGIDSINLSLDTLDEERFLKITRRNQFKEVHSSLLKLISHKQKLKINMVVMAGENVEDIIPMAALTLHNAIEVRFIEEMPFNGGDHELIHWNYKKIESHLKSHFNIGKLESSPSSTALQYQIKGAQGTVGIIPAYSRTFCGTCNRIRITAKGDLRTCLYSKQGVNLKQIIRSSTSSEDLKRVIAESIHKRYKTGFHAEKAEHRGAWESMSTIGG